MYVNIDYNIHGAIPLLFRFPLLPSLLLPIRFPLLTWNPPCCDRIRPPRSQVARKLIFSFPSPCSYTPHSKIPTPWSYPDPNIHSLGRHHEPGSQDRAQVVPIDKSTKSTLKLHTMYVHMLLSTSLSPSLSASIMCPCPCLYPCPSLCPGPCMYRSMSVSVSTFMVMFIFISSFFPMCMSLSMSIFMQMGGY